MIEIKKISNTAGFSIMEVKKISNTGFTIISNRGNK